MITFNEFEELVYGDRGLVLTHFELSEKELVAPERVVKFLLTLNEIDYAVENIRDLFSLKDADFENFENHMVNFLSNFDVDAFMFRNSFANTYELTEFSPLEQQAMFAQYSIVYGQPEVFELISGENPRYFLEEYFRKGSREQFELKTNKKTIKISFKYEEDSLKILKNILQSKTVLREHQILVLEAADLNLLKNAYSQSDIRIKENAIFPIKRFLDSGEEIDLSLFKDTDQTVRIVANLYSFEKNETKKRIPFKNADNEQLNNTILKGLFVKLPTKIKKAVVKSLDSEKNVQRTVENMFKYHGFWKKILEASRFESEEKMDKKYPTFQLIKEKLYHNDRSRTLNARVEKAKFEGDYYTAAKELSANPGALFRNILEYIRYREGLMKAKKTKPEKETARPETNLGDVFSNTIDFSSIVGIKKDKTDDIPLETKEPVHENKKGTRYSKTILRDGFDFLKSPDFVEVMSKGNLNTKLLWQAITLFEDERLYTKQHERYINATKTEVYYDRGIPALETQRVEVVKNQFHNAIKRIKQAENQSLGKVFISEELKNMNIEFSGRGSKGVSLSGEYLSPGSKIPFDKLVGEDKILRIGIAWRGKETCDIDHSLNLFKPVKAMNRWGTRNEITSIYYGEPTLKIEDETIITSSGDIVFCEEELFSTELIDLDLDKAIKHDIGNMLSSAIQYNGKNFDNYEVLWFMNIIDKKDRVAPGKQIKISLDKMDYAIQVNAASTAMLGFHINLEERCLEVLNINLNSHLNFSYSNAETNKEMFAKILATRPPLLPMDRALKDSIAEGQLVENIEEADVAFVGTKEEFEGVGAKIIQANREREEVNQVIF